MQLVSYCVVAGISIFFLIGCLLHIYENDIFSSEAIKKFKRLIFVLMFEIAIDAVFALLNGQEVAHFLLYLVKDAEFILNLFIAFLVFDIFYERRRGKKDKVMSKLRKVMIVALIVGAMLQVAPFCWGQNVFFIDENNVYHRGNLMLAYIAILVFVIVVLMYEIIKFSSKTQSIMKATLFSFIAVLVAGIVLRGVFPDNNWDFLCISVAILFLLVYYSCITLRVDPLTQLLNRHVYSKMLERIDYSTIIIIVDANNFKMINDMYGHECGDQALKQLARAICKAYGKYAYCFRLGGDEFCAIQKPGVFDRLIEEAPHYDAYAVAEKFTERLDELIIAQAESDNDNNSCLRYGVSQGYGIFYAKEDYPSIEERIPIEQVVKLADKRMFRNKNLSKENHSELISDDNDEN